MKFTKPALLGVVMLMATSATFAQSEVKLRVGAARVDINPVVDALPESYRGINDRIYARGHRHR